MIININMTNGESISLPKEQAEKILDSKEQLIGIYDNGKWTGKMINKAHIVSTVVDHDASRNEALLDYSRTTLPTLK